MKKKSIISTMLTITLSVGLLVINKNEVEAATYTVAIDSWTIDGNESKKSQVYSIDPSKYNPVNVNGRATAGDYNGDGKEEAAYVYDYGDNKAKLHIGVANSSGKIEYLTHNWEGTSFNANSLVSGVVSGDFDGDGKDEIAGLYRHSESQVSLMMWDTGKSGLSFSCKKVWTADKFEANNVTAMTAGDYNGDGIDEVAFFYNYGGTHTKLWTIGKKGNVYDSDIVWENTKFNADRIRNKATSGNYFGNKRDEIAVFYDYKDMNTKVWYFYKDGDQWTYKTKIAWEHTQFNADRVTSKVTSTRKGDGTYDEILTMYDYANDDTGLIRFTPDSNGSGKLTNKIIWKKEFVTWKIDDRVSIAKLDGKNYTVLGMYYNKPPVDNTPVDTVAQKRAAVVKEAEKHLGKPYEWGATGPSSFDCSGLTQYVYRQALGIEISRTTYTQIARGDEVKLGSEPLEPGDLLFFGPDHVGIYVGNNKYIHAPKPGEVVKYGDAMSAVTAARRIIY